MSYQSFVKLAGEPSWNSSPLLTEVNWLPPLGNVGKCPIIEVPSIEELGYEDTPEVWNDFSTNSLSNSNSFVINTDEQQDEKTPFKGGESEGLRRLKDSIANKVFMNTFSILRNCSQIFIYIFYRYNIFCKNTMILVY